MMIYMLTGYMKQLMTKSFRQASHGRGRMAISETYESPEPSTTDLGLEETVEHVVVGILAAQHAAMV